MNSRSLFQWLRTPLRYPATSIFVVAALAVHIAYMTYERAETDRIVSSRTALGAVASEGIWNEIHQRNARSPESEQLRLPRSNFTAPLPLWRGEWWRITVSGFHHTGLLHLLPNCLVLIVFGYFLERRVGSLPYFMFFLLATTVSLIPSFLFNINTVGLSGGIAAVFGLMIVVRDHDEELHELLPQYVFVVGIVAFFLGFVSNAIGFMPVSNLAHFSGLIYGWLAGWAWYADSPVRRFGRWVFVAGSLMIVPALYLAAHPFWNADYHRVLAWRTNDPAERVQHLSDAAHWDPMDFDIWHDLAHEQLYQGNNQEAWRAAISGFSHSRADLRNLDLAVRIFSRFKTPAEQRDAVDIFYEVFGSESQAWDQYIGLTNTLNPDTNIAKKKSQRRSIPAGIFVPSHPGWRIDRGGVDLFNDRIDGVMTLKGRRMKVPRVDPGDSRSALLGLPM